MAVFELGTILRNRRIVLGITQEALADGICSVPTLSRIENGERMPTRNHFEMLMQRLGYSALSLDFFTDKVDFLSYNLKNRLRYAYMAGEMAQAEEYFAEYERLMETPPAVDQQFLLLYRVILHQKQQPPEAKLSVWRAYQLCLIMNAEEETGKIRNFFVQTFGEET